MLRWTVWEELNLAELLAALFDFLIQAVPLSFQVVSDWLVSLLDNA